MIHLELCFWTNVSPLFTLLLLCFCLHQPVSKISGPLAAKYYTLLVMVLVICKLCLFNAGQVAKVGFLLKTAACWKCGSGKPNQNSNIAGCKK